MGNEATVTARFSGKTAAGKARLETETLYFRGGDLKLAIPFKQMSKVTARGEILSVSFPGGTASFDLGPLAAKWADKILHPPSRLRKIGVKPEWRVCALGVAQHCDAIFFGVTRETELSRLEKLTASLKPNGALWIIRPKGRPEISERATMAAGKAAGLVDVKVVGFSATHAAEKFVIPLAQRGR